MRLGRGAKLHIDLIVINMSKAHVNSLVKAINQESAGVSNNVAGLILVEDKNTADRSEWQPGGGKFNAELGMANGILPLSLLKSNIAFKAGVPVLNANGGL